MSWHKKYKDDKPGAGGVVGFLLGIGAGFMITGLGVGLTPEIERG